MEPWLTRQQLIEELDALIWVDEQCFELAGRCASTSEQELHIAWCARTALHHAWRAEQLRSIRPFDVHAPDGGSLATPLPEVHALRVEPLLRDAINLARGHTRSGVAPEAPNTTIDALRSDILSRQLQGYRQLVARLDPIRDAPVIRMLRIVSEDLAFDLSQS
jgi:hypothetical protein